jgi:NADH dehydrogenase/NADH:ubiquinone oxidoreductase subunit G
VTENNQPLQAMSFILFERKDDTEMVDEEKGVMPETKAEVETPAPKADAKVATVDTAQVEAELEKTREALKKANKEAADRRKRLDELEAAEEKRKLDAMSDNEKVLAKLQALETEKAQLVLEKQNFERRELQRKVAKAVGLPDGLALRLQGTDEEAMTEDAKAILELLPKPEEAKKQPPKIEATNPANGQRGETVAQLRERLKGPSSKAMYDPTWGKERGGGVRVVGE